MEKVCGIGGLFFRAKDPAALGEWYERHLGVARVPKDYDAECWTQDAGETVFAPFALDTDYFGAKDQQWMINFRVPDLTAMVTQLKAAGIAVDVDDQTYPNGVFARLEYPEGNPIQLWETQHNPDAKG